MPPTRTARLCVGGLASALLSLLLVPLSALPAFAADTVIDFEDLPAGTEVRTQYASRGLVFGESFTGQSTGPTVASAPGKANSGTQVAVIGGCSSGEFCAGEKWGKFVSGSNDAARSRVQMFIGPITNFPTAKSVTLTAFDATGTEVGSMSQQVPGDAGVNTFFIVDTGTPNITYFHLNTRDKCCYTMAFDQVAYDPILVPNFAIGRPYPGGDAGLAPGKSVLIKLLVNRVNGSEGDIELSISGLPTGVSATFSPQIVSGAGKSRVDLTLHADAGAPRAKDVPVTVTGTPLQSSAGSDPRSLTFPVTVAGTYGLRARGIEVTQGIQARGPGTLELPDRSGSELGTLASPVTYSGVRLQAGGKTIVRFFGDLTESARVERPGAVLYGYDENRRLLPGPNPLVPESGPLYLYSHSSEHLTYLERIEYGPEEPFVFTLPPEWTHGTIVLYGKLLPPMLQSFSSPDRVPCESPACLDQRGFALGRVVFTPTATIEIVPVFVNLVARQPPPADRVFAAAQNILPVRLLVPPYQGHIEAIDIFNSGATSSEMSAEVLDRIQDWDDDNDNRGDLPVGVAPSLGEGVGSPDLGMERGGPEDPVFDGRPVAVVNARSPLTSVTHEIGHALGRPHAAFACGAEDTDKKGPAETWPPDEMGYIHGVGIDRRTFPYELKAPGVGFQPPWFDFMSYCSSRSDVNTWTSDRGWDDIANLYRAEVMRAAERRARDVARPSAAGHSLEVTGIITSAGAKIIKVGGEPLPPLQSEPNSGLELVARNSGGEEVRRVGMAVEDTHADFEGGGEVLFFTARIPAADVAAVEVESEGTIVADRSRTPHRPKVRIISPTAGMKVGAGRNVAVRWEATDEDGDPLLATVAYSPNGGQSWRTIFVGPSDGEAQLPSRFFTGSSEARVRVDINDGFSQDRAVSALFSAIHHGPQVRIESPAPEARVRSDTALYLSGAAFDQHGEAVVGSSLRWYFGGRLLGRGRQLSVSGLSSGQARLRLVAVDAEGRRGSASLPLTVVARGPVFTRLDHPRKIPTTATTIPLTVAASVNSTLRIRLGGEVAQLPVGPKPQRIAINVRSGTATVVLELKLTAAGRSSFQIVRIRRR